MKILIVGSWVSSAYEEPLYQAFKKISINVHAFKWCKYLHFSPLSNLYDVKGASKLTSILFRLQNKFIYGPAIRKINKELLSFSFQFRPNIIFLYRATHIWPETVKSLKAMGTTIFLYNNDDPFSRILPKYIYRHYIKTLSEADWIFSYREKNIKDYKKLGYSNSSMLRSSYTIEKSFPIPDIKKTIDIIFIGHYENDGRDQYLFDLFQKTNFKIEIWGNNWESSKYYDFFSNKMKSPIKPIYGELYNKKLNQSKIALVFLSKINSDTYTRRCFEIPAAKTMMMCEFSNDVATMFEEDKEIVFFKDATCLLDKVKYYLENEDIYNQIIKAGYQRLIKDGHEITDRALEIVNIYKNLKS